MLGTKKECPVLPFQLTTVLKATVVREGEIKDMQKSFLAVDNCIKIYLILKMQNPM